MPNTLASTFPLAQARSSEADAGSPSASAAEPAWSNKAARALGRPAVPRRLSSQHLFDGRSEIEIEHGESVYRLRLTSLGKLILTK